MRPSIVLGWAVIWLGLYASPAWAQFPPTDALTAVVRIDSKDERSEAIWKRLGGQTVDLDVTLVRVNETSAADLSEQVAAAAPLAETHRGRVVIWFRTARNGRDLMVYIAEPKADRIFVRRLVQTDNGADARSATAEAAALVVRSGLQALTQGSQLGRPSDDVVRADKAESRVYKDQSTQASEPKEAVSSLSSSSKTKTSSEITERARSGPVALTPVAFVGWSVHRDGIQRLGHHGLTVQAGLARGLWSVRAAISAYPEARDRDALTEIFLARQGFTLGLYRRFGTDSITVLAAVTAGPIRFTRRTQARIAGVTATASRATWALAIGPAIGIQRPLVQHSRLRLHLHLGIDALAGAPTFSYRRDGRTQVRSNMATWQPYISAGIAWQ